VLIACLQADWVDKEISIAFSVKSIT